VKSDHAHYVPCLRWKQGEYQAVMGDAKNRASPDRASPDQDT